MSPATDWLWYLGGGIAGAVGLGLLLWSLWFGRQPRGRRCRHCWYDMTAVPGLRCPECGREAKSEQALHRRRRRWRFAGLAVLLLVAAAGTAAWPPLSRGSHWRFLSTEWLVGARTIVQVMPQAAVTEYDRELWGRPLSIEQYNTLTQQLADEYLNPAGSQRSRLLYYNLGQYHPVNGRLEPSADWVGYSIAQDLSRGGFSILRPDVALHLVDGLACRWRSGGVTDDWEMELRVLGRQNPAAARYMLERMFKEPDEWALYLPYPAAADGEVMRRCLEALAGEDSDAKARAATCLLCYYLDVTAFDRPPPDLAWILQQYPPQKALIGFASPAGENLLAVALSGDPGRAVIAGRLLAHHHLLFEPQVAMLERYRDHLDPSVFAELDQFRRAVEKWKNPNQTPRLGP